MPILVLDEDFLVLVIALSIFSGIGSFLHGKREERLKGGAIDFFTEITLAVVVGLVVAYIGEGQNLERTFTCALVLVLSNNGADAIEIIRKIVRNHLKILLKFNSGEKRQ